MVTPKSMETQKRNGEYCLGSDNGNTIKCKQSGRNSPDYYGEVLSSGACFVVRRKIVHH